MNSGSIQLNELDKYMLHVSTVVGLPIAEEYGSDVMKHLQISLNMAALLETVPLQIEDDFAQIFRA